MLSLSVDHMSRAAANALSNMGGHCRVAAFQIVNEVRGIKRATYDIMSKPPGTIEWE